MNAKCCDPRSAAVALARWGLGVIFLFYGINKFRMGLATFAEGLGKQFEPTWLPAVLVAGFAWSLPFIETILGALLLLGLARNGVLFATGILLIFLTFGQVVAGQPQVVFQNFAFLFMTAVILFAHEYDCWVVPCCPKRSSQNKID